MNKIIEQIIDSKKKKILELKTSLSEAEIIEEVESVGRKLKSFKRAIFGNNELSLIAEIKQASPSKGLIRKDFDPIKIAEIYEKVGAAAVSVLTEEDFFQGNISHLIEVKDAVSIPVLRKDFILDTYQVYESYLAGADCVLLIAKIVSAGLLSHLFNLTKSLGMDAMVEVHNEDELEVALRVNADIIGINNRDLDDFTVNKETTARLAPLIPKGKIVVAESGIDCREDIEFLSKLRINAVLIGEAFLKEEDIEKAINSIWT